MTQWVRKAKQMILNRYLNSVDTEECVDGRKCFVRQAKTEIFSVNPVSKLKEIEIIENMKQNRERIIMANTSRQQYNEKTGKLG